MSDGVFDDVLNEAAEEASSPDVPASEYDEYGQPLEAAENQPAPKDAAQAVANAAGITKEDVDNLLSKYSQQMAIMVGNASKQNADNDKEKSKGPPDYIGPLKQFLAQTAALTEEDTQNLNNVQVLEKIALNALSGVLDPLVYSISKQSEANTLGALDPELNQLKNGVESSKMGRLVDQLNIEFPDYAEYSKSPEFNEYVNQRVPLTNMTINASLEQAIQQGNYRQVREIIKGFEDTRRAKEERRASNMPRGALPAGNRAPDMPKQYNAKNVLEGFNSMVRKSREGRLSADEAHRREDAFFDMLFSK